jgi:elongation factor P--beta-lysine ligase
MNPYNEIQNLDRLIDDLTKGLDYSRNKAKDTANINTLINARNCFEEMLNCKYHTDVVETMIYDKMLTLYLETNIAEGNDLTDVNKSLMHYFDNMFSLGSEAKKHLVFEQLEYYINFHELKDGNINDDTTPEQMKAFEETRDKVIKEKVTEAIIKIKSLIKFKLK